MNRYLRFCQVGSLLAMAVLLVGCLEADGPYSTGMPPEAQQFLEGSQPVPSAPPVALDTVSRQASAAAGGAEGVAGGEAAVDAVAAERIEERRRYVLRFATEAPLLESFDRLLQRCAAEPTCRLEGSQSDRQAQGSASAWIELQLARQNLSDSQLLAHLESAPELVSRELRRDDRSLSYLDIQARLHQQETLRDRLLDLATQGRQFTQRGVQDLLAVERELARVQGSIESMQSQLALLRQRTDNIRIRVDFQQERVLPYGDGLLAPLRMALDQSADVFVRSLGNVILAVVFLAPWLIIGLPVIWGMLRLWRGIRRLWQRRRRGAGGGTA